MYKKTGLHNLPKSINIQDEKTQPVVSPNSNNYGSQPWELTFPTQEKSIDKPKTPIYGDSPWEL